MNELDVAIYSTLSGDATLVALVPGGIHNPVAPHYSDVLDDTSTTEFPVLAFSSLDGEDQYTLGAPRYEEIDYSIRVGAKGFDPTAVHAVLARVFTLLHDASLSVSGHTLMYARRRNREPIRHENRGGSVFINGGARYHFEVQPT